MIESSEFIQLLTSHQSRIYAYILSLVFDPGQADDVLQETNAILWQKHQGFESGTNFVAWSFRVAHFQIMAHRKTLGRDRHVFDDDLIREVARVAEESNSTFLLRQSLLRKCIEKLSDKHRDLIRMRYRTGATLAAVAEDIGKSTGAVKQLLFRIRTLLADCVNFTMTQEADS